MAKSSDLLSLLFLFILIAIAAFIGFIAWSVASDVSEAAAKRMEKKNIRLSKDGIQVGVKEISTEDVSDSTQSTLVKAWNLASWPVYKSKLGFEQSTKGAGSSKDHKSNTSIGSRKPYSKA